MEGINVLWAGQGSLGTKVLSGVQGKSASRRSGDVVPQKLKQNVELV